MQRRKNLKKIGKIILTILLIAFITLIVTQANIMTKIYPQKYSEYVEKYSEEYNLDPLLIYSIIKAESNFSENAKSKSNAIRINASNARYCI